MSTPTPKTVGFWFAALATVLVIAALVAGVSAVGGPGDARDERLDEARRADLRSLERVLQRVWRRGDPTPSAYDELVAETGGDALADPLLDPVTKRPYGYRALSDSSAELCATFARQHEREYAYAYAQNGSEIEAHAAGRACFTITQNE